MCQSASAMTRATSTMYSSGTPSWNRSLIELTKTIFGFGHRSGSSKLLGHEPKVEALFVGLPCHAPESFGERLGVAMLHNRG